METKRLCFCQKPDMISNSCSSAAFSIALLAGSIVVKNHTETKSYLIWAPLKVILSVTLYYYN